MPGSFPGGWAISKSGAIQSHTKGDSPWPWRRDLFVYRWRRNLPNTTEALTTAAVHISTLAEHCGCGEDDLADLEIAVREALANALLHGNRSEEHREIRLRVYAAPDVGILIAVRDEGPGFDPDGVPDPRAAERMALTHGRGLLLMRELVDHVEYRKSGAEVVLFKMWGPFPADDEDADDEDGALEDGFDDES